MSISHWLSYLRFDQLTNQILANEKWLIKCGNQRNSRRWLLFDATNNCFYQLHKTFEIGTKHTLYTYVVCIYKYIYIKTLNRSVHLIISCTQFEWKNTYCAAGVTHNKNCCVYTNEKKEESHTNLWHFTSFQIWHCRQKIRQPRQLHLSTNEEASAGKLFPWHTFVIQIIWAIFMAFKTKLTNYYSVCFGSKT